MTDETKARLDQVVRHVFDVAGDHIDDQWSSLNFLERHLLCGHLSWPEGREPTPAELPHLTTHVETFDTFVEITWTCSVCRATAPVISIELDDVVQERSQLTDRAQ